MNKYLTWCHRHRFKYTEQSIRVVLFNHPKTVVSSFKNRAEEVKSKYNHRFTKTYSIYDFLFAFFASLFIFILGLVVFAAIVEILNYSLGRAL